MTNTTRSIQATDVERVAREACRSAVAPFAAPSKHDNRSAAKTFRVLPGTYIGERKRAKAMMRQTGTAESQIKALIEAWSDAVRRHDILGILAHHEQNIVMFDVPPPLQSRGVNKYKKTWDLFFKYHKPSQAFDIEELEITAGEDVAFAVAIMH